MRTRSFAGLALGAVVVLGWACTNKTGPAYTNQADFCTAKAKAICQVAQLCAVDQTACQTYQDEQCNVAAQQATATGTRFFDSGNAQACIDDLNGAYGNGASSVKYDKLAELDTKCARVFTGKLAQNAPCTSDYDCANNFICALSAPDATTRICVPAEAKKMNEYCNDPGSQCATDTYCTKQMPSNVWECTSAAMQGGACSDTVPCVSSLHCAGGICQPRQHAGGSCTSDADCASDAPYCDAAGGNICTIGLTFATGAADCRAIAGMAPPGGSPDAGTGAGEGGAGGDGAAAEDATGQ
jgi:hypothetical protein